jgi:undecaprenyl-diphosphatase
VLRRFSRSLAGFGLVLLLALPGAAQKPGARGEPAAALTASDAIVLGLVEGVTEFLPISSTGHLIIANDLLGLDSDQPLRGEDGSLLWHKPPSAENPAGVPLTIKVAADAYAVIIQAGAILAVVLLYRRQFVGMALGLLGRSSPGFRLLRNVLLAFLPVAVAGFLLHDWIDRHLFSVPAVIAALVGGAFLMLAAERWRRQNSGRGYARNEPSDLSPTVALRIGLIQCLALWPGTSRSMVTIVGGYLAGLSPARAAEFSFLVGLPTLAGAAVFKAWKAGPAMIAVFGWEHVLLGALVAGVSAALAVKFLVHFLSRHGLQAFAYYRLALAAVLAGYQWL